MTHLSCLPSFCAWVQSSAEYDSARPLESQALRQLGAGNVGASRVGLVHLALGDGVGRDRLLPKRRLGRRHRLVGDRVPRELHRPHQRHPLPGLQLALGRASVDQGLGGHLIQPAKQPKAGARDAWRGAEVAHQRLPVVVPRERAEDAVVDPRVPLRQHACQRAEARRGGGARAHQVLCVPRADDHHHGAVPEHRLFPCAPAHAQQPKAKRTKQAICIPKGWRGYIHSTRWSMYK